MKNKITVLIASLILFVSAAGCGGVKKDDIIGNWKISSIVYNSNEVQQPHIAIYELRTRGIIFSEEKFESREDGSVREGTWEISGSDIIVTYSSDPGRKETYKYSDGMLIIEFAEYEETWTYEKTEDLP